MNLKDTLLKISIDKDKIYTGNNKLNVITIINKNSGIATMSKVRVFKIYFKDSNSIDERKYNIRKEIKNIKRDPTRRHLLNHHILSEFYDISKFELKLKV